MEQTAHVQLSWVVDLDQAQLLGGSGDARGRLERGDLGQQLAVLGLGDPESVLQGAGMHGLVGRERVEGDGAEDRDADEQQASQKAAGWGNGNENIVADNARLRRAYEKLGPERARLVYLEDFSTSAFTELAEWLGLPCRFERIPHANAHRAYSSDAASAKVICEQAPPLQPPPLLLHRSLMLSA